MASTLTRLLWCLLTSFSLLPVYLLVVHDWSDGFPDQLVMPVVCGVLMFLCVACWMIAELQQERMQPTIPGVKGVFFLLLLTALSLFLVSYVGFFAGTLLLFVGGAKVLHETRISRYLFGAALWAAIVYLLFAWILMVPLPEGSLFS